MKIIRPKFEQMCKMNSCLELSEGKPPRELVTILNEQYIITGSCTEKGTLKHIACWGNKVVPLKQYKGSIEPMPYYSHSHEVHEKRRERGYTGMLFTYKHKNYVCTDQVKFEPEESEVQLEINLIS
jgi:hypothetical protein